MKLQTILIAILSASTSAVVCLSVLKQKSASIVEKPTVTQPVVEKPTVTQPVVEKPTVTPDLTTALGREQDLKARLAEIPEATDEEKAAEREAFFKADMELARNKAEFARAEAEAYAAQQ
jgi:NACalpha-BTF3-like transcription factor